MRNERFEWDDEKARSNLAKHGVSFDEAALVFDDPFAWVEPDDSDPFEERWATTGTSGSRLLYVVSADREAANQVSRIRIISARRATRHEQDNYYRQALSQE